MMIAIRQLFFFLVLSNFIGYAQMNYTVKGNFPQVKNKQIELIGFEVLKDTIISKTKSDHLGNFELSYSKKYVGGALLKVKGESVQEDITLVVLLNKENFVINWLDLADYKTLHFENSLENDTFFKGMTLYQESESILAGLKYLKPLYKKQGNELKWLEKEIKVKESMLPSMLSKLAETNYAGYYLKIRKLVADMPVTASSYSERIPDTEKQFKTINFKDERLLKSGLLTQLIEGYYQLMESYGDTEIVTEHCNSATDALLKSLNGNNVLKQEIAIFLFKVLEKRSLFKSAEHVALYMLNDNSCSLDDRSIGFYEQYRKMAVGNQAPEIKLVSDNKEIKTLSSIKADYKLVVFGSSWCNKCKEEVVELKNQYKDWKENYNLEIVFIALDSEKEAYDAFISDFAWISSCDFKGWKTQAAVDYFIFATPTLYLLDSNDKILLKPFSGAQVNSWLIGNGKK
ncbi:TlpA family protein disulfide reductase [Flavobacterium hercynium]|uniref:Thioredoxin domain-containing protein n=1 Tax=Flavobacterium hercynium TaxID=387094 RepID=A0A226H5E4_9FLAO|nr:thioredoxin family protein [Flavobacterium hercynium]OXA89539.1 hypothetical protein B0A66_14065 [Flavobacterium hercynium]SMP35979.1 Thioredoxin-like [Flavobacterium hercynium]